MVQKSFQELKVNGGTKGWEASSRSGTDATEVAALRFTVALTASKPEGYLLALWSPESAMRRPMLDALPVSVRTNQDI